MTGMYAAATRLLDNRDLELRQGVELRVGASLDSPAMTMSGVFPVADHPGRLGAVRVWGGGGLLFEGQVDRQQVSLSAGGLVLELEARSKGALLLDNEALPCVLTNVHLSALFSRVAAPYGFVCYNPNPSFVLGMYTVRKDLSEWEALCGFTRRAWGITPYVQGDTVRVNKPNLHTPFVIANKGKGYPFSRLEEAYIPYKMVSQVVLRDSMGSYSASATNSSAAYHGVRRKRYVIPTTEFVDQPAMDANQRIRRSMLDSTRVTVTLPGLAPVQIGQQVEVADAAFPLYNLLVGELEWRQGAGGLETRLWLVSSVYY